MPEQIPNGKRYQHYIPLRGENLAQSIDFDRVGRDQTRIFKAWTGADSEQPGEDNGVLEWLEAERWEVGDADGCEHQEQVVEDEDGEESAGQVDARGVQHPDGAVAVADRGAGSGGAEGGQRGGECGREGQEQFEGGGRVEFHWGGEQGDWGVAGEEGAEWDHGGQEEENEEGNQLGGEEEEKED